MEHYFTNNEELKSEIRKIEYSYKSTSFLFYSDLGVFSKDRIDYGSKFLLECYLEEKESAKKVLDMGCGYGFIGIVISKITGSNVTCVDVNKRAVHLTEMNIKNSCVNVKAFVSDAYENIKEKYDVIITNPPIRVGKVKLLDILIKAREYLNKDGEMWFVIRKDQGAKSVVKELEKYYMIENIDKSKGFYVYKANFN